MTYCLRIADMAENERPRERLLTHGAKVLATAELIAILLGTGQGAGKLSAVGLGQYILQELGKHQREPLVVLRDINAAELIKIPGIGPAKATAILAAIELGKRTFQARPGEGTVIDSPGSCGGGVESRFDVAAARKVCSSAIRCQKSFIRNSSNYHWNRNRNFSTPSRDI